MKNFLSGVEDGLFHIASIVFLISPLAISYILSETLRLYREDGQGILLGYIILYLIYKGVQGILKSKE